MSDISRWMVEEFNRGVALHSAGDLEKAEIIYRRILDIYPYLGQANFHMGLILQDKGPLDDALRYFKLAVDAEPGNHLFRRALVQALSAANRPYEARTALEAGMQRFGFAGREPLELTVHLHAACQRAAPEPRQPVPLPEVIDPDFDEVLALCWPYSMSSVYGLVDAFYSLYSLVRYVVKYRIPGDFVECGVYAGGMSLLAALTFIKTGDTSRDLYLYDTFEGMPPPTVEDSEGARIAYDMNTKDGQKWAAKSLDEVKDVICRSGYPADKIHFIKGLVEETIPNHAPDRISILRLDTDFYSSTLHELNHLYPRLSSGGGLIIDDYGYMPGARQAVDEYFAALERPMFLNRVNYTVRSGIKL